MIPRTGLTMVHDQALGYAVWPDPETWRQYPVAGTIIIPFAKIPYRPGSRPPAL
jgi:hypothetical protein